MSNYYLYTETAFHHEGDVNYLKNLIQASKESGANGIKFQVLTNPTDFISKSHSSFQELSSFCFAKSTWKDIFKYTEALDLDIIMMPLNIEALELCNEFSIKYLEIHSVSFRDKTLHEKVKDSNVDLILGIGGRSQDEINYLLEFYDEQVKILMVGFQAFPSELSDIKLGKIEHLKRMYPKLKIGYADHSSFDSEYAIKSNEYAYLLGAEVFEKHITLKENKDRVDSASAISKEKISEIIKRLSFIRDKVIVRKDEIFQFSDSEKKYRQRELKLVAAINLKKGDIINESSLNLKMIDHEKAISDPKLVLGKKCSQDINLDQPIIDNFTK